MNCVKTAILVYNCLRDMASTYISIFCHCVLPFKLLKAAVGNPQYSSNPNNTNVCSNWEVYDCQSSHLEQFACEHLICFCVASQAIIVDFSSYYYNFRLV